MTDQSVIKGEDIVAPRSDVSEERRGQILEAAISVFSRMGFHRARMEDVARESGLAKGTLYLYYRSKDALIGALLERIFAWGRRDLEAALVAEGPAGERLLELGRRMSGEVKRLSVLLPVWFEFYAVAARNEAVKPFVKRYFEQYREALESVVREGIESGEFRQVDAAEAAVAIISLFEGVTLLWAFDPDVVPLGEQMEASTRLLIEGLIRERP
jgi:TetR/AcrR family fatty acid metabolism transcriptional regulator